MVENLIVSPSFLHRSMTSVCCTARRKEGIFTPVPSVTVNMSWPSALYFVSSTRQVCLTYSLTPTRREGTIFTGMSFCLQRGLLSHNAVGQADPLRRYTPLRRQTPLEDTPFPARCGQQAGSTYPAGIYTCYKYLYTIQPMGD